jgi:hypothetical protein
MFQKSCVKLSSRLPVTDRHEPSSAVRCLFSCEPFIKLESVLRIVLPCLFSSRDCRYYMSTMIVLRPCSPRSFTILHSTLHSNTLSIYCIYLNKTLQGQISLSPSFCWARTHTETERRLAEIEIEIARDDGRRGEKSMENGGAP